jgi:hypothetical protein
MRAWNGATGGADGVENDPRGCQRRPSAVPPTAPAGATGFRAAGIAAPSNKAFFGDRNCTSRGCRLMSSVVLVEPPS